MQDRKKSGPAPFAPTKVQRNRVMLYVASGVSEPGIARVLGICQNTLRRYFSEELRVGREVKIAENLNRLDRAADKGNVTAMKHLDAKFGVVGEASLAEPQGKKAVAKVAAETAGDNSEWGSDLKTPTADQSLN